MGLLSWIVLGLIAGLIAEFLMGGGLGLIGSIILGIIGAVVGGWLASMFGLGDVTGLNIGSIVISVVGAPASSCSSSGRSEADERPPSSPTAGPGGSARLRRCGRSLPALA